jgi:hypothetical protein
MTKRNLTFRADHKVPAYASILKQSETGSTDYGYGEVFYAQHPYLGCGRTYKTRADAVRNLLHNSGYTNIFVNEPADLRAELRSVLQGIWPDLPMDSLDDPEGMGGTLCDVFEVHADVTVIDEWKEMEPEERMVMATEVAAEFV